MTRVERAYLAGLIDGEGHINKKGQVQIVNTELALMTWCVKVTGVGRVQVRDAAKYNPKCKTSYVWHIGSSDAKAVLQQVEPYLTIKRNKARKAIELLKYTKPKKSHQPSLFKLEIVQ